MEIEIAHLPKRRVCRWHVRRERLKLDTTHPRLWRRYLGSHDICQSPSHANTSIGGAGTWTVKDQKTPLPASLSLGFFPSISHIHARAMPTDNPDDLVSYMTKAQAKRASKPVPGFKWEDGRKLVDDGQHVLPADDQESDRMHRQHWMIKEAFGGNFLAPVEELLQKGAKVLDAGCGPGTWTTEMASTYPKSHFYGVDLFPLFPEHIMPLNCDFYLADIVEGLPFPDGHFDFVHQRNLILSLRNDQWAIALKELRRVCKPTGWIQLGELDFTPYNAGATFDHLWERISPIFVDKGFDIKRGRYLGEQLRTAGLENVEAVQRSISLAPQTGVLGKMHLDDLEDLLSSLKPWLRKEMEARGIAPTDNQAWYEDLMKSLKEECIAKSVYTNWFIVYGQEPSRG